MALPKGFIKTDYSIQTSLGILFLLTIWLFWGLLILIPFGAWQVLSALILVFGYQDEKRRDYLKAVTIYGVISLLMLYFEVAGEMAVLLVIPPPIFGVWYYIITRREYKSIDEDNRNIEGVLDADLTK